MEAAQSKVFQWKETALKRQEVLQVCAVCLMYDLMKKDAEYR